MNPYLEDFGGGQRYKAEGNEPRQFKGPGFASVALPDGYMSEWSMGTPYGISDPWDDVRHGRQPPPPSNAPWEFYPSVYQDITPWDLDTLLNEASYNRYPHLRGEYIPADPLLPEVLSRARTTALVRAMQGLPPFWIPGEPTQTQVPYHVIQRLSNGK